VKLKDNDREQKEIWKSHGIPSRLDISPSDAPIEGTGKRFDGVDIGGRERFEFHQRQLVTLLPEFLENGTRVIGESPTQCRVCCQPANQRLDIPVSHVPT
jgi:hypothetical protein